MEAVMSSKSWSRLHSPTVSSFPTAKQSLSIGRIGFCPRKLSYNNCLGLKLNRSFAPMGNSIPSFNFKSRSIRAQASAELVDVDEIRRPASYVSILANVFAAGVVVAVAFFAVKAVGHVVFSLKLTDVAGDGARALALAANFIVTTLAYLLLDKLLLPKSLTRMLGTARGSSILSNITSSDDVNTFARFVTLKAAGIPQEQAHVLAEEVKDLSKSEFDSLVANIRLYQQHEEETKAWSAELKASGAGVLNKRMYKLAEKILNGQAFLSFLIYFFC